MLTIIKTYHGTCGQQAGARGPWACTPARDGGSTPPGAIDSPHGAIGNVTGTWATTGDVRRGPLLDAPQAQTGFCGRDRSRAAQLSDTRERPSAWSRRYGPQKARLLGKRVGLQSRPAGFESRAPCEGEDTTSAHIAGGQHEAKTR